MTECSRRINTKKQRNSPACHIKRDDRNECRRCDAAHENHGDHGLISWMCFELDQSTGRNRDRQLIAPIKPPLHLDHVFARP